MYLTEADGLAVSGTGPQRVIVVGAGAVGLYAASQLAARGRNVVVIEAGDSHLRQFCSRLVCLGRARALGHQAGTLVRGLRLGLRICGAGNWLSFGRIELHRSRLAPGLEVAGFRIEEIAPTTRPTYPQTSGGRNEFIQDDDVWRGSQSGRPDLGPDFEVFFTRWMGIPNFAEMFAKQMQSDEKLSVLSGHTVVGFRGTGGRIDAVRVVNEKGKSHWIGGDTVILAGGWSIGTARLLLYTAAGREKLAGTVERQSEYRPHFPGRFWAEKIASVQARRTSRRCFDDRPVERYRITPGSKKFQPKDSNRQQ